MQCFRLPCAAGYVTIQCSCPGGTRMGMYEMLPAKHLLQNAVLYSPSFKCSMTVGDPSSQLLFSRLKSRLVFSLFRYKI